jgi:hypothetical protein
MGVGGNLLFAEELSKPPCKLKLGIPAFIFLALTSSKIVVFVMVSFFFFGYIKKKGSKAASFLQL